VRAKKTPILSFRPDEVIRSAEHIQRILAASGTLPERPPSPDEELDDDTDDDTDDDLDDDLDDEDLVDDELDETDGAS
jgi:hypothetical protein